MKIDEFEIIGFSDEETSRKIKLRRAHGGCLRYMAPKKDAVSCEKLRGGANILRSAGIRMRELSASNVALSYPEHIGIVRGTRGTETS